LAGTEPQQGGGDADDERGHDGCRRSHDLEAAGDEHGVSHLHDHRREADAEHRDGPALPHEEANAARHASGNGQAIDDINPAGNGPSPFLLWLRHRLNRGFLGEHLDREEQAPQQVPQQGDNGNHPIPERNG
jgi:hypothetical protein